MRLGRRTVYALLLAIICLNILARLPQSDHEAGIDSFYVHSLARAIAADGKASWILNAFGYLGWYPLAYPPAGPFVIAGFSDASGVTLEGAILLLSIWFGIAGALVAFILARSFLRDDLFALTVAFVFSLAPRFISFTIWTASTRNLFMVMVPVFLYALLRTYKRPTLPNLLVLFPVLVVILATHRLTILLVAIVLAYIGAYLFLLLNRVVRIRFTKVVLGPAFRRWAGWSAIAIMGVITIGMLATTQVLAEYSDGVVCQGDAIGPELCNLGVSISRSVGLALPLGLVGIFAIVRERGKGLTHTFLVISMLALIPTFFLRQYTGFYILPFVSLLAGYGMLGIVARFKHRRRQIAAYLLLLLMVGGFSYAVVGVEVERGTTMSDANYTTALYMPTLPDGNFVANDGLLGIRVSSISGRGGLPLGGAGTTFQSPELLIYGVYSGQDIINRTHLIGFLELTVESDSPFETIGINANLDWIDHILAHPVDQVSDRLVTSYNLQYYLENQAYTGAYYAWGKVRWQPQFQESVYAQRYRIYAGTTDSLYLTFGPQR